MDEVTSALLEASRKLKVSEASFTTNSSSCRNIPSLTTSSPTTAISATTSSSHLLHPTASSSDSSPVLSPNSSFASSSVATSPSSPCFLSSWFSGGTQRNRTVSESHATSGASVKVDLSPWLAEGNNARELRLARVRRNSTKDMEEAMSGGLSRADMYMPPM